MRKSLLLTLLAVIFLSCEDSKSKGKKLLSDSSGKLNHVSVVIDNDLWQGNIGEAVRDVLAAPLYGLPQDEPTFSLSQIPTSIFTGFARNNRTVLKIEKGNTSDTKIAKNVFAKPQKLVLITGNTNEEIIAELKNNSEKIINAFRQEELKERQRQIKLSLQKDNNIKQKLGLSMEFPSVYRVAKEEDNFFWIRKDLTTGHANIMLYELPINAIKRNDSLISQIIAVRDSVSKTQIPARLDDAYMITEEAYAPFLSETIIDNKPAVEVKGLWDVVNDFMGGPFVSYLIEDKINQRWIVGEGFIFAPSVGKREYMLEMEAILRSIKLE